MKGGFQSAPAVRPRDLSRGAIGRLARATLAISKRAYATAGVTNAAAKVKTMQAQGLKRRDYRFAGFDRGDRPCLYCHAPIIKIIASRRLYYCPQCQATESLI